MAIENERKYVLDVEHPRKFMNKLSEKYSALTIKQGYLNDQTRIRESIDEYRRSEYHFTFKLAVNGVLVEIEDKISKRDFALLWTKVDRVINKVRVVVPHDDLVWEIDFFFEPNNEDMFLVMAEVEMPEGMDAPEVIPDFISDHLLYSVPRNDKRFYNSHLVQPNLVRKTIKDLKDGSKLHSS